MGNISLDSPENFPDIEISEATVNDVEGVFNVRKATWLATYPNEEFGITPEAVLSLVDRPGTREQLRSEIEKQSDAVHTWVAKENGSVIGFCFAFRNEDGSGTIERLYVLPGYQGRNTGSDLLQRCLAWFGSPTEVRLAVATYNVGAIRFYERNGFVRGPEKGFTLPDGTILPDMEMVRRPLI